MMLITQVVAGRCEGRLKRTRAHSSSSDLPQNPFINPNVMLVGHKILFVISDLYLSQNLTVVRTCKIY